MEALLALIAVPLGILNLLGGIVAVVWLAFLGKWGLIAFGIAYAFAGTFLIAIVLLPGMLLAAPAAIAADKNLGFLAFLLGLPSLLWTYCVLFGSCFAFMAYAARVHEGPILPYLLWAYATAIGPWSYMAQKEQKSGNEYSLYTVSGAQVSTVLMGISLTIDATDYSLARLWIWMLPGAVLAILLQSLHMYAVTRDPLAKYRY